MLFGEICFRPCSISPNYAQAIDLGSPFMCLSVNTALLVISGDALESKSTMKPTANSNIGPGTAATYALTTSSADVSAATVSQGKQLL